MSTVLFSLILTNILIFTVTQIADISIPKEKRIDTHVVISQSTEMIYLSE